MSHFISYFYKGAIAMQVKDVALTFDGAISSFDFGSGPHIRSGRGFTTPETRTISICEPALHSVDVNAQGMGEFGKDCQDSKSLIFEIAPPGTNPPTP
jgi:hypothetical protein